MSERGFFYDGSDTNSDIQTNLYGTRQSKFYGTVERNQYQQDKENMNRINRIKAARGQEFQKAKENRQIDKEHERLTREEEFKQQKLREYAEKVEQLRKLEEAKRIALEEAGQAHKNAETSNKLREDRERHKIQESQQNAKAAAERAKQASMAQKEWDEQINGPRRKLLENQKKIMEQESIRAHQLAAEFREKEKDRSEEREDYTPYEKFNKNISKGVYKKKVVGDFSKSQLHNSIVVSHSGEGQVSAFDAARAEEERTTARREDFRASKDDVRMKSLDRWKVAAQKEKKKKMDKEFEDQMQRLQKAKNIQKIEEGKKYPEMQVKPATKLQQQNRNQKLAEKEFEDLFMGKRANSEGTANLSMKGKKTTTRPPFKAPTLQPARPNPLVEQSTLSAGFDNTTNEFQEQDHEESEEEEEQPRSTAKEPSARRDDREMKSSTRQPEPSYQQQEESEEEEEEEEEEPRSSAKYSKHDESQSQSQSYYQKQDQSSWNASRSGYDQTTPEESTMRQDDNKRQGGLMSFGDRQQRGGAQQHQQQYEPSSSSSYQQESQSGLRSENGGYAGDRDNYLGQSQSSALSDSRYRREEEASGFQEKKPRKGLDNDINSYINEQEAFLQNLENHRKKLNEKLKTTQDNYSSPTAFEQTNKSSAPQAERQAPNKSSLNSTSKTVAVKEDEAIEDLQKRANDLLTRFMKPTQGEKSDEESEAEEEEEEDSLEYSPAKYGKGLGDTKSTQNNYMEQTQSYAYSQDDLEEEKGETPEKNNRYRAVAANHARDDSPSELDYSMSAGERSEKKQKASMRMDYGVSFGTKQFVPQTETFGKTQNPFEDKKTKPVTAAPKEDKKAAWKMEFDMADDQKPSSAPVMNNNNNRRVQEQRERPSASNKQGELVVEEQGQGPSLAELFQKNRKKMVEKYEQHQKEHPEKPEVKEAKPVRTKEEILKQRKAMMEYKAPLSVKAKEKNAQEREAREEEGGMNDPFKKGRKSKSKEPKPELLDRLAFGKKATVDKKEMLKLTNKNYELLPEVKKKKEEEKKKEEQRKRRENAKKLDKEIRSKLMK